MSNLRKLFEVFCFKKKSNKFLIGPRLKSLARPVRFDFDYKKKKTTNEKYIYITDIFWDFSLSWIIQSNLNTTAFQISIGCEPKTKEVFFCGHATSKQLINLEL